MERPLTDVLVKTKKTSSPSQRNSSVKYRRALHDTGRSSCRSPGGHVSVGEKNGTSFDGRDSKKNLKKNKNTGTSPSDCQV